MRKLPVLMQGILHLIWPEASQNNLFCVFEALIRNEFGFLLTSLIPGMGRLKNDARFFFSIVT